MSFEEEFDKIIRRKAEEENYPFNESNWEKASKLLDADRKAARTLKIKKLYLPVALIVALGSISLVTYSYLNTNEAKSSEVANKIALENKNIPAPSAIVKEQVILNENPGNALKVNALNIAKPQVSEISLSKVPAPAANNKVAEIKDLAEAPATQLKKDQLTVNNFAEAQLPGEGSVEEKEIPVVIKIGEPDQSNGNIITPIDPIVLENTTKESIPPSNMQNEQATQVEDLQIEQLSAVYSTLPYEITDSEVMATPFTLLSRYDDEYYKAIKSAKKHYLNAELGTNYLFGWDTNEGKDGVGFNWFGGFNYGRYLTKKMSISVGLQAYNIAHIEQPFYLAAGKEYGFGSMSTYTRVASHDLYYMSVPLKFNYAVNTSNTIGLGINSGYLFNSQNSTSSYYILDTEEKIVTPATKTTGVYEGTRVMNFIVSAHYKTQLSNRFALNAEFNYGLTDIFKNMGEIKNTEAPMGIRFSLQYTLFDK